MILRAIWHLIAMWGVFLAEMRIDAAKKYGHTRIHIGLQK